MNALLTTPVLRRFGMICRGVSVPTVFCLCLFLGANNSTFAQTTYAEKALPKIAGGVLVGDSQSADASRWNRLVVLSKPKLASGDLDALGSIAKDSATVFDLSILATVVAPKSTDGVFELKEVGVGYSMVIGKKQTIVTPETQEALGADLGFVQRRVLAASESQLGSLKSIVHTTTMVIFDAPCIILRKKSHRKYLMRHCIWIDPATGEGAALLWLMGKGDDGKLQAVNKRLRLVAFNTTEVRRLHVDGDEFTFGFPSEKAFAMEDLPPGKKINWTKRLIPLATRAAFSSEDVTQLSEAMDEAIRSTLVNQEPQKS